MPKNQQINNEPHSYSIWGNLTPLATLFILAGCSQPYAITVSGGPTTTAADTASTPTTETSAGGTTSIIQSVHPALAVRGTGCLNCHANIQGNIVTDFGNGSAWFMEQEKNGFTDGNQIYTEGYYSPFSWQSLLQLTGQIIAPEVTVPVGLDGATPGTPIQISTLMNDPTVPNYAQSWQSYFSEPQGGSTMALTQNVFPGGSLSPVLTSSQVYIGAPSAAQILSIAPTAGATQPFVQVAGGETGAGQAISGLSVVAGSASSYVTNTGPLQCSGLDVVIAGTLLLNNAQIYAENGGCKLYVTGSVFIEGPITYLNSGAAADPTDNLQISSATSIVMGVGLSGKSYLSGRFGALNDPEPGMNPLHIRLIDDSRQPLFRTASAAGAYSTWAAGVYGEATNIGAALIQDASITTGAASTALSAAGQNRVAINFNHLLLNAPVVHSRYLGTMNGVIIAEIAEMSLGQFSYSYDPVFATAQISAFPKMPGDILCIGSPCNPIMSP